MNWDAFLKDDRLKFPRDSHSLFPASNYHWLNYSVEKMLEVYAKKTATEMGTKMHNVAAQLIEIKQPLPDINKTLNMYVNDCIFHNLIPEKQLYYSEYFRGTADALGVDSDDVLRVFDLKTGQVKASLHQLEIYVAYFCLDFGCLPTDLKDIVIRIYQNDDIVESHPGPDIIVPIMDKVVTVDSIIRKMGGARHALQ